MAFTIHVIETQPFAENTYVLYRPGRGDALIVDPGFEPNKVMRLLDREQLAPAAILNTHGHVDHIAGNDFLKKQFPSAPIIIGRGDAPMLTDAMLNLSGVFGLPIVSPPADRLLDEGMRLELAGFDFQILEIPGHSPGHIVFVFEDDGQSIVLGGDVLFAGSIGRTDFPGGSMGQLVGGIRNKLWPLPDDTIVYPGHGPETTIGAEKRSNPFCAGMSD
jgi:glyoxylase-like metal-dependent hydrolase (beta-lactamase superfamily II)